jgi:hypothetical protein
VADRPDSVRIGPLRYRILTDVEKIKAASDSADIKADAEWTAYSDHDKHIIAINPDNPADCQRRDLLHEVIHCCLRFAGVEPNAYAETVAEARGNHGGYTVEEFVVAAQSGPLLGVLVDNPGLVKWLTHA